MCYSKWGSNKPLTVSNWLKKKSPKCSPHHPHNILQTCIRNSELRARKKHIQKLISLLDQDNKKGSDRQV